MAEAKATDKSNAQKRVRIGYGAILPKPLPGRTPIPKVGMNYYFCEVEKYRQGYSVVDPYFKTIVGVKEVVEYAPNLFLLTDEFGELYLIEINVDPKRKTAPMGWTYRKPQMGRRLTYHFGKEVDVAAGVRDINYVEEMEQVFANMYCITCGQSKCYVVVL